MANQGFNIWVTLLSPQSARLFTAGLVERGFTVRPAADSRQLLWESDVTTLVAITVSTGENGVTRAEVLNRVKTILNGLSASWYSIIIHEHSGGYTWDPSNIKLPPKEEKPPQEEPKTRFDVLNES